MHLLEPSKGLSSKDTMFPMEPGWWNFWDDNLIGWCVTSTIESRRRQKFELMWLLGGVDFLFLCCFVLLQVMSFLEFL
jgi:hypothetical protein